MTFLSREYRAFIEQVALEVRLAPRGEPDEGFDRYRVEIIAFPPDRKKRDVDNLIKPTLDALTRAGVWADDSLVVSVEATKCEPATRPFIVVKIHDAKIPGLAPEDFDEHTRKYPQPKRKNR